jgi:hydrogenase maturation protease
MSLETPRPPLLILGLGNPILTDDRVGHEVARALHARRPAGSAALLEACVGGMELLHVLEGWQRVVVVDAVEPGRLPPGEVAELSLEDLEQKQLAISPHVAGLGMCLRFGRTCGLQMPDDVRVFGIGVIDPYTFGERCTPIIEKALPAIVEAIEREYFGEAQAHGPAL